MFRYYLAGVLDDGRVHVAATDSGKLQTDVWVLTDDGHGWRCWRRIEHRYGRPVALRGQMVSRDLVWVTDPDTVAVLNNAASPYGAVGVPWVPPGERG